MIKYKTGEDGWNQDKTISIYKTSHQGSSKTNLVHYKLIQLNRKRFIPFLRNKSICNSNSHYFYPANK